MKYTTDEAHSLRQRQVAEAKANAIRCAAEEFYAEGHEVVSEEEFKSC